MTVIGGTSPFKGTNASWAGWTDERVKQLKLLYVAGLSASQIAKELGGVSRMAVIAKLHRIDYIREAISIPGRQSKAAKKLRAPVVKRDKGGRGERGNLGPGPMLAARAKMDAINSIATRKAPKSVACLGVVPGSQPRHWSTRRHGECSWPIGEGADLLSCCAPVERGGYCGAHGAAAFVAPKMLTPKRDGRRTNGTGRAA